MSLKRWSIGIIGVLLIAAGQFVIDRLAPSGSAPNMFIGLLAAFMSFPISAIQMIGAVLVSLLFVGFGVYFLPYAVALCAAALITYILVRRYLEGMSPVVAACAAVVLVMLTYGFYAAQIWTFADHPNLDITSRLVWEVLFTVTCAVVFQYSIARAWNEL